MAAPTPVLERPSAAPLRQLRWAALGTECYVQYACGEAPAARAFERAIAVIIARFASPVFPVFVTFFGTLV